MLKKALSLFAASLLLGMIGCSFTFFPEDDPLVGTWNLKKQVNTYDDGRKDSTTTGSFFSNRYIFSDDNSFSSRTVVFGIPIDLSGTWSATDDFITLTTGGQSQTWGYSISGSELTLTQRITENSVTKTTAEIYEKQ